MPDILIILGLFASLLQVCLTAFYTKCTWEQTRLLTEQKRQLKETQESMIAHERHSVTAELIRRFNSKDVQNNLRKAADAIRKRGQITEEEKHAILAYLSFLEEVAMAVLRERADEGSCKDFFRSPFLHSYTAFQKAYNDNPEGYSFSHRLYIRWR